MSVQLTASSAPRPPGGGFDWRGGYSYPSPYPAGEAFRRDIVNYDFWYAADQEVDLGFKTYVEPAPEPGAVILLGTGMLGLVGFAARRNKAL